jgi:tryptophan-rich sensory protein
MNDWYSKLARPPLTPPNWVFGPVWTVLYIMIAISLILYIKNTRQNLTYWALAAIILHLITNFSWTGIFFGLQRPGWALVDIILLDLTLALLIVHFWQTARLSSVLLWPYLVWVLFATYLNAGFYLLNRF